jgi:hypothetical protein
MHTADGGGEGRNSIVIIPADTNVSATYFPFTFGIDEDFNFEVRDFHYDATNDFWALLIINALIFNNIFFNHTGRCVI